MDAKEMSDKLFEAAKEYANKVAKEGKPYLPYQNALNAFYAGANFEAKMLNELLSKVSLHIQQS